VTRDDRVIDLLVLATRCPECAGPFRIKATRTAVKYRRLTRRCPDCRAPGRPVRAQAQSSRRRTSGDKRADRKAIASKLKGSRRAQKHAPRPPRAAPCVAPMSRAPMRPDPLSANPRAPLAQISAGDQEAAFRRPGERERLQSTVDDYLAALGLV
jgi:hypothetical protein